ncbi:hypothetical protein TNCV_3793622 [Trichonephila clavipes]|nr:hypothetical protein TNCV_3793622 [Trichonephila clavipes]
MNKNSSEWTRVATSWMQQIKMTFLQSIFTGEETWYYAYDRQMKRQRMGEREKKERINRMTRRRVENRDGSLGNPSLSELVVQAPTSAAEVAFNGKILPRRIIAMMLDKPLSQKRSRRTRPLLRPHQWCANESEELRANLGHANER